MRNDCSICSGEGEIPDPDAKWWQIWKMVTCPSCKGTGYIRPPYPKPDPPPAPPKVLKFEEISSEPLKVTYGQLWLNDKENKAYAFDSNGRWVTYEETDDLELKRLLEPLVIACKIKGLKGKG